MQLVARRQKFLTARWTPRFAESYAALPPDRQERCDETAMALIKGQIPPGLRVKPIQPDKYFNEARINSGDRIVFRIEGDEIEFVDIVKHDDINRYGRQPKLGR